LEEKQLVNKVNHSLFISKYFFFITRKGDQLQSLLSHGPSDEDTEEREEEKGQLEVCERLHCFLVGRSAADAVFKRRRILYIQL